MVLGSPPASGKTSLLQLVKQKLLEDKGIRVLHRGLSRSVTVSDVESRMARLGITEDDEKSTDSEDNDDGDSDSGNKKMKPHNSKKKKYKQVWVLLDDAQLWYGEEYWPFWQRVVKHLPTTCSQPFRFIIAATYDLSIPESQVHFKTLQHFQQTSICEVEVDELCQMHITDPDIRKWELFISQIKGLSMIDDGQFHIGTVIAAVVLLQNWYKESGVSTKDETAAVAKLRSSDFISYLGRCHTLPSNLPESSRDEIVNAILDTTRESIEQNPAVAPFLRAGILRRDGNFRTMAALWFYNNKCFPSRATNVPETLDDLIILSVGRLSASRLRNCLQGDFPKGAPLQHFFNETMSMNLTFRNFLIPELNTVATDANGKVVSGELDFYINGSLHWCIELLRNGDKIGEHLGRFQPRTGKYRNLVKSNDYLVVDCRPPKRGRGANIAEDRCTLYFEENFSKCRVQMRTKPEVIIPLQP